MAVEDTAQSAREKRNTSALWVTESVLLGCRCNDKHSILLFIYLQRKRPARVLSCSR